MAINFPHIDPVAISIGPLAIRWYALAYLIGFILGWRYAMRLCAGGKFRSLTAELIDDFFPWAMLGVILGGRLGYVLFYNVSYYLDNPQYIPMVWQGGMSFHGGMLGMVVAMFVFARIKKLSFLSLADVVACVAPIGLFFGRIANFINAELYGRATDMPWGIVFPGGGDVARHPSQLYEAFLEGLVLFAVLWGLSRRQSITDKPGILAGVFLAGYGLFRFAIEWVREPDAHIGLLNMGFSMGQVLSLPMIIIGIAACIYAVRAGHKTSDKNIATS